ncbi:CCR4-NOT transcription complex subunit 9-like [Durio zibethinus]|uniref:CCR4-NOT transcription complex subunit 9-like n=1 Tax=Durio zibethinus TaxID=66656 RepID=A0A6P6AXG7_DURZI|nr:CCR4-NOT transcription complex subunit 9-like [Durio zibethinus]
MAYVPAEYPSSAGRAGSRAAAPTIFGPTHNHASAAHHRSLSGITRLIRGLDHEETREQSLDLLCKYRQARDDLGILLWNSFGTVKLLLQEITSVYRPLLSGGLSERAMTQVCNAIALLQSVASHPDTRMPFIKASIPVYLYPFLNTMNSERNYECLRLTSLGVIGSLAKVDDAEVVDYLLSTQIFPSCLRCMEVGRTLSKTVATFIIYRILLNEKGLKYCFILADRYLSVSHALAKMVEGLAEEDENSPRLLRNIIGCYLRLSENQRTRQRLSTYIPSKLVDNTYIDILRGDPEAIGNLQQLIYNLKTSQRSRPQPIGLVIGAVH